MDDIAIKVESVSKTFKLPHEKNTSIKSAAVNFWRRQKGYELQEALKDVSFEVKKGEFFGIVGRNGSGKSTLLKLLAGIYTPTEGQVHVHGKLTPFIELGVGFNPELTGRENVFLNGALLGFNRKEMEAMYDDIVEFAELERFMDQKLKNYSSGMQVRLAFSIAIRAQSDVLLIDEVLAVGDAAFQQKCYEVFSQLKKQGKTMVLVTHDMSAVQRFCDRALLINQGNKAQEGSPKDIADAYLALNYDEATERASGLSKNTKKQETKDSTKITSVILSPRPDVEPGAETQFVVEYTNPKETPIQFGLQIFNEAGVYCYGTNTNIAGLQPFTSKKGSAVLSLKLNLVPGNYSITAALMNESATAVLDYRPSVEKFRVKSSIEIEGVALLEGKWTRG